MKIGLLIVIVLAVSALSIAQTTSKKFRENQNETSKTNQPTTTKAQKMKVNVSELTTKTPELTTTKNEITFDEFKKKHNKTYKTKEAETEAEKTFKASKAKIDKHNSDPKRTYSQGINAMADVSNEKFKKTRLGMSPMKGNATKSHKYSKSAKLESSGYKKSAPDSFDLTRFL
jgi:Cathepsin propeptide inhibitor domain (I29)